MTFEDQLKILTYYHLEEHSSGWHLLQVLAQEDFAATHIAPPSGIQKSAFFEAINTRGLEQIVHVYEDLQKRLIIRQPAVDFKQRIPLAKKASPTKRQKMAIANTFQKYFLARIVKSSCSLPS